MSAVMLGLRPPAWPGRARAAILSPMRYPAAAARLAALAVLALAAPSAALDLAQLEKGQLQLKTSLQTLYAAGGRATQDSASIKLARLTLDGRHRPLWDGVDVGYAVQYELTRSTGLLDAYVEGARKEVLPGLALKLRAGQTRRPFSYENLMPVTQVELIRRSKVVEALVPGRDVKSVGRDLGGFLEGTLAPGGREKFLVGTVGVFNGEGANAPDRNKQKDLDLRLTSRPLPWLGVGASYTRGRRLQPAQVRDRRGAELLLDHGPFAARGEYIYGRDHFTLKDGWYAQAQCWLYKELVQAVGRYEEFDPDKSVAGDRQKQTSVGVNYYPFKTLRFTAVLEMERDRLKEDRGLFMAALSL